MFRFLIACFVACLLSLAPLNSTSAHEAHDGVVVGRGYGLANGDRVFYGPCSGVEWRHRGPARRTVCAALRGDRNVATGNGPIARAWRSRRCSR